MARPQLARAAESRAYPQRNTFTFWLMFAQKSSMSTCKYIFNLLNSKGFLNFSATQQIHTRFTLPAAGIPEHCFPTKLSTGFFVL
jgi:hypothetical protein